MQNSKLTSEEKALKESQFLDKIHEQQILTRKYEAK